MVRVYDVAIGNPVQCYAVVVWERRSWVARPAVTLGFREAFCSCWVGHEVLVLNGELE
jgi:hypothetical protein